MRKAFKFRLYPTRRQAEALDGELAAAQRLYNAALEQRRTAYRRSARWRVASRAAAAAGELPVTFNLDYR